MQQGCYKQRHFTQDIFRMKKIYLLIVILLTQIQFGFSQCSTVPVKEAVRNGNFELGYLPSTSKIGSPTTSHTSTPGGPFDFSSDLRYGGEWNGKNSTCNYSMGDQYGVGRIESPPCKNGSASGLVYGQYGGVASYKDHTTGTNKGFSLIVDFNSSSAGTIKRFGHRM